MPSIHASLILAAIPVLLAGSLPAQVTEWGLFKVQTDTQEADNLNPTTPDEWFVLGFVETTAPTDIGMLTISGGGLAAPVALTQDGNEWSLDVAYPTRAAMDADYPSGNVYLLQATGGTLGAINQFVTMPPSSYPATPRLIGTSFSDLRSLDEQAPLTVSWNNPGPIISNGGLVLFELEDLTGGNFPVDFQSFTGATSVAIPANTLNPSSCFRGQLVFGNTFTASGAGAFIVDGGTGHGKITFFDAATFTRLPATQVNVNPLNGVGQPINPQVFQPAPVGVIPGQVWQPFVDHSNFATNAILDVALVSFLPVNLPTPNGQLLLDPAGSLTSFVVTSPGTPFSFPVDWNCAYFGRTVRVQAATVYPSGFLQLTNALDVTVGGG